MRSVSASGQSRRGERYFSSAAAAAAQLHAQEGVGLVVFKGGWEWYVSSLLVGFTHLLVGPVASWGVARASLEPRSRTRTPHRPRTRTPQHALAHHAHLSSRTLVKVLNLIQPL